MTYLRSVIETPQRLRLSLSDTADWDEADPDNRRFTLKIDEPTGGPIVLRLSGDVDVVTAPILAACLDEIVLHGRSAVVDLLRTSFVGCAALTALAAAGTRIREQRSHLTVAAPQHLRRVIALADMDAVCTFDTLAHAFTAAHTATSSAGEEPLGPSDLSASRPRRTG